MNDNQNEKSSLRNYILRRKLNISKDSWDHLDDKWHDEIYVTKNDKFKHLQISPKRKVTEEVIKTMNELPLENPVKQEKRVKCVNWNDLDCDNWDIDKDALITKLEKQVIDLRYKIVGLSIINMALMAFHFFRK